jgi:two-component system chemotaxis response regulator CheY
MKCLVVDDSAISRRILVNSLRTIGFEHIVEAADGKQALLACDDSVDIVITDWNMPGMGGVELVRRLRTNPVFASLPILLITARNVREDVVEAARAGVDGYMVKPFTPDTLRAKLEELFNAKADEEATGTDG